MRGDSGERTSLLTCNVATEIMVDIRGSSARLGTSVFGFLTFLVVLYVQAVGPFKEEEASGANGLFENQERTFFGGSVSYNDEGTTRNHEDEKIENSIGFGERPPVEVNEDTPTFSVPATSSEKINIGPDISVDEEFFLPLYEKVHVGETTVLSPDVEPTS